VDDYSEFPTTPTGWQERQAQEWETLTPLTTEDAPPPKRRVDLTAPAGLHEATFWGESGLVRFVPEVDAVAAYGAAIDALIAGETRFDARFGLEVVRVLTEVESALGGS